MKFSGWVVAQPPCPPLTGRELSGLAEAIAPNKDRARMTGLTMALPLPRDSSGCQAKPGRGLPLPSFNLKSGSVQVLS